MIRWNARDVAESRGIKSAYAFALFVGLPYSGAKKIWDSSAKRLDLESLDKVCTALGVSVSEILKQEGD